MGSVSKTHFSQNSVETRLRGAFWINVGATLGAKMVQNRSQESSRQLLKNKVYFLCVFVAFFEMSLFAV